LTRPALVPLALAWGFLFAPPAPPAPPAPARVADWPSGHYTGRLVRIIDGDTFVVKIRHAPFISSDEPEVRLSGIDTPETDGRDRVAGRAAAAHLRGLLEGQVVYLRFTGARTFTRFVAYAWVEGEGGRLEDVGDLMVAAGHAVRVDR